MDNSPSLWSNRVMKQKFRLYGGLFLSFFKIAALTLGGGAVMLPLMEEEFLQRRQWISSEDMVDVYTLCNSLPGVIALNSSLMIGRITAGFWGAICSVLGVLVPSVVLITALASVIQLLAGQVLVERAFLGVRAGVTALLLLVVIRLGKKMIKGKGEIFIAAFAFVALEVLGLNAVLVVLLCALLGRIIFGGGEL
jgi:chromate transporter